MPNKWAIDRITVPELMMMGWHDVPCRLLCLSVWRTRPRYGKTTNNWFYYFGSNSALLSLLDFPLQHRQVRNELAIEKIVRQRSIDGRSQF